MCNSTISPSSNGNDKPTFCGLKGKRLFDVGICLNLCVVRKV